MNTQKKKYVKPTLKKYGKIVELTMKTGSNQDLFTTSGMSS